MNIEIITPEEKVFTGDIISVSVPGKKSPFQVLKDHAPIISSLDKGKLSIQCVNGESKNFDIDGGVIEVKNNKIIVLVEALA